MTSEEILQALKEGANFELTHDGDRWQGYGAINNFQECRIEHGITRKQYDIHYSEKKKVLESISWAREVENPRNPKPDEYPGKDGEYITMLDCDEHKVLCNIFKDGRWLVYDKTHVKWWMPIPVSN